MHPIITALFAVIILPNGPTRRPFDVIHAVNSHRNHRKQLAFANHRRTEDARGSDGRRSSLTSVTRLREEGRPAPGQEQTTR